MKYANEKNTGITLIALIITIIVLLILSGITIGALTSNNSILKQAGNAKKETRDVEEKEKLQLAIMEAATEAAKSVSGEITKTELEKAIKNQFGNDKTLEGGETAPWAFEIADQTYYIGGTGIISESNATTEEDSTGRKYSLPKGATYKEGTVDAGLVIIYKGSEFVWIPVNSNLEVIGKNGISTGKKIAKEYTLNTNTIDNNGRKKYEGVLYDFYEENGNAVSNEMTTYGQGTGYNREPDMDIYLQEDMPQEEYDAMIESLKKYGGFYVGRYESSKNGEIAASVPGIKPMSSAASDGNRWYGLYEKQKNFTNSQDSMVAGMIWGSQYDAMINWIISTETDREKVLETTYGNHGGGIELCGSYNDGSDKMNNIYDLEGNVSEDTQEISDRNEPITRGGTFFGSMNESVIRCEGNSSVDYGPYGSGSTEGSRMSLYIK